MMSLMILHQIVIYKLTNQGINYFFFIIFGASPPPPELPRGFAPAIDRKFLKGRPSDGLLA